MESTSQATWEVLMSKIYGPFARSMPPVTAFNRRVDYGWYTLKARPHSPLSDSASAEAQYVSRGTLMESAGSRCYREDCGEVNAAHWLAQGTEDRSACSRKQATARASRGDPSPVIH